MNKVKIKLNKDQLHSLCVFTMPIKFEAEISMTMRAHNFDAPYLGHLFSIVQIGYRLTKLYVFGNRKIYNISLTYAEAACLLTLCQSLYNDLLTPYDISNNERIKTILIGQICNYQPLFYKQFQSNT